MTIKSLFLSSAVLFLIASSAHASPKTPKELSAKVEALITVISDGYAVGYPKSVQTQSIKGGYNIETTLVLFTIEGFSGGNNWSQYLAAFLPETTEDGKPTYALIDVFRIGSGGWRTIPKLNAKTISSPKNNEATILIETLENTRDDPPNFPSKKSTLSLVLKNGRFYEK